MDDTNGRGNREYTYSQTLGTWSWRCDDDCRALSTCRCDIFIYLANRNWLLQGLPSGVLNVVHGGVPTVNAICDHPAIKAISFVGGDRAGKHIYDRFVPRMQLDLHLSTNLNPEALPTENVSRQISVRRTTQFSCQTVWLPRYCHEHWTNWVSFQLMPTSQWTLLLALPLEVSSLS